MSFVNTFVHLVNHPLNRPNKVAAIIRFLKWQIGSRLVPGEVIFKWINDSKFFARPGENGVTGNIYCGLHEFSDMTFLLHALRKDDLFVDIGSNVGSYTVLAASAIGAKGYSFEPVPSTYERLLANIRLNNLTEQVVPLNIALGNSQGEIYFSSNQNCKNHVIAEGEVSKSKIVVKVSTLDEELKAAPFLMKIDVEGYETPVLEGAANTLGNEELCAVIMELNGNGDKYGYDESKILRMMADYKFKTYAYKPFERVLAALEGKNLAQGNTIFIRNLERITERIKTAPKINVHGVSL